nr:hypothetical protein [Chryseolinea sp.]
KMYVATLYDDGSLINSTNYTVSGDVATQSRKEGNTIFLETKFKSGKPQSKLSITCGDYSNMVTKWFPDGELFYFITLSGGKRHGLYQFNSPNGQTEVKGNFIEGKKDGFWEAHYYNGKKEYTGWHSEGEGDSVWTFYHLNGNISSTSEYKNDEREGITKQYDGDGKLVLEKNHINGDMISYRPVVDGAYGEWIPFKSDASIVVKYSNGKIAFEENYKNGILEGVKRLYYSSGQLYSQFQYALGDYAGPYTLYYANGKILEKGNYILDEKNGEVEWFNEDGSLNHTENYLMGLRQGKSVWYEKGVKVREFNFWGGMVNE